MTKRKNLDFEKSYKPYCIQNFMKKEVIYLIACILLLNFSLVVAQEWSASIDTEFNSVGEGDSLDSHIPENEIIGPPNFCLRSFCFEKYRIIYPTILLIVVAIIISKVIFLKRKGRKVKSSKKRKIRNK